MPLTYVVGKKGFSEIIKHAVKGMLPKNKLQDIRLKNLEVTE
jgi:ribosomal protein L13